MLRYAITNRLLLSPDALVQKTLLMQEASLWAEQSVDFVQLREKDLPPGEVADIASAMLQRLRARKPSTRLLINSRADVAAAVGADGVHLTSHPAELTPDQVRSVFAQCGLPAPTISVSCHDLEQVSRAASFQVAAILFGPIFGKTIDGLVLVPAVGLARLQEACRAAGSVRVLALGGVTRENTKACLDAGADGVAGIRLFRSDG